MEKGMVTWRTNSSVHYLDDGQMPICKAKSKYGETWITKTPVTCRKCKSIAKKFTKHNSS